MRTYVTQCRCGELRAEGSGSSKKLSKKRAAEMMVTELKKLPPLSPLPPTAKPKKIVTKPKQNKNLIKVTVDCSVSLQLSNANGKVDLPSRSAAHARPVPTLYNFDAPCGLRG